MGIDQWKHKYLFPFGNIQPITAAESSANQSTAAATSVANRAFSSQMGTSNNNSTLLARPINPSMDVGFNNPSKQQDSIYSENMSTYR